MRQLIHGVGFCLMIATTLHSIAVGNLLPAWVKVACVDINPATVTKLTDRGSTSDDRPRHRRGTVPAGPGARTRNLTTDHTEDTDKSKDSKIRSADDAFPL